MTGLTLLYNLHSTIHLSITNTFNFCHYIKSPWVIRNSCIRWVPGSCWSHPWLAIVDWSHLCHASFTLCLRQSVVGTHPAPSYCLIGKLPGNPKQLTSLPGTHWVQEFLLTQGDSMQLHLNTSLGKHFTLYSVACHLP